MCFADHRNPVQCLRHPDRPGAEVQGLRRWAAPHHHRPPGRAVPQPRAGLRTALPLPLNNFTVPARHLPQNCEMPQHLFNWKKSNTRCVIFTFSAFITFLSNAQNAHLSMFAPWMAQLGFFLPPMPRPAIKLTSVQLHLFLRDLNQGHLTYWATPATARLALLELSLQNCY